MLNREFYRAVADLLGTQYEGFGGFVHRKRTRWNNRNGGRVGCYPGFGTVQAFGETVRINLTHPVKICETVQGKKVALDLIWERLQAK